MSFAIYSGEIVNLAGNSGVGKTTLLDLLAGIREPLAGRIFYKDEPLEGFAPVGYVFSDDNFIKGSLVEFLAAGASVEHDKIVEVIKTVDLWERLGFFAVSDNSENLEEQGLSRGEVQKLLLAQALYRNENCVLFDEAFNHLSFSQAAKIIDAFREKNITLIIATHRPEVQALCDRNIFVEPPYSEGILDRPNEPLSNPS